MATLCEATGHPVEAVARMTFTQIRHVVFHPRDRQTGKLETQAPGKPVDEREAARLKLRRLGITDPAAVAEYMCSARPPR